MSEHSVLHWTEKGKACSATWRSESNVPAPTRIVIADDTLDASSAYRMICEGTALLWRGDYQNGRQLLNALIRRVERKLTIKEDALPAERFHLHRRNQVHRTRILGMLLLSFDANYALQLRRAPDVKQACEEVYGSKKSDPFVTSMRELLGMIGAHEWRKKGIAIPAMNGSIHAHYGVFAPIRSEYLELVSTAPLPSLESAFDIGTGTGVLAAILANRGVAHITATEQDTRALICATENINRLKLSKQIKIVKANLFPEGRAPLIVCNPPWIPARPSSPLEHAVYDPDCRMLYGFLNGLSAHLTTNGEGWLILSDIAEHLGLRTREALLLAIENAKLKVIEKIDIKPTHPRVTDKTDPLYDARSAEVTSLWRLTAI